MQKKKSGTYYEKWVGRHASFPPRRSVKGVNHISCKFQIEVNRVLSSHTPCSNKNIESVCKSTFFVCCHLTLWIRSKTQVSCWKQTFPQARLEPTTHLQRWGWLWNNHGSEEPVLVKSKICIFSSGIPLSLLLGQSSILPTFEITC